MKLRAWVICGILFGLANSTSVAKPPVELPPTGNDGKVTPKVTQDFFQTEAAPARRILPKTVEAPRKFPLPIDPDDPFPSIPVPGSAPWQAKTAFEIAELNASAGDLEEAARWYAEVVRRASDSRHAIIAASWLEQSGRKP